MPMIESLGPTIAAFGAYCEKRHFKSKKYFDKKIHGNRANAIVGERLIEGCYQAKYANLIIRLAEPHWKAEQPRFIVAVNWMEGALAGSHMALGADMDWGNVAGPLAIHPTAIANWTYDTFVRGAGTSDTVNLPHKLIGALRTRTGINDRVRLLQTAKKFVAHGFGRDFGKSFYNKQIIYTKNVWDFHSKYLHSSHSSDIGQAIRDDVDLLMNDGQTYDTLPDYHQN